MITSPIRVAFSAIKQSSPHAGVYPRTDFTSITLILRKVKNDSV
jgi:hypothetical protein